jgi:hypothetical protein
MTAMQIHQTAAEAPAYMSLKNVPGRTSTLTTAGKADCRYDFEPRDDDAAPGMPFYGISAGLDEHTGRRDALPEFTTYRDTGCEYAPACLTCPLAQCRYDLEGRRISTNVRQLRVVELRRQGWTPGRVASELGVSRRTVFRLSKA